MEELLAKIETSMREFAVDTKLLVQKGNKAAGARSRKASLELIKMFKEWRKLSTKN